MNQPIDSTITFFILRQLVSSYIATYADLNQNHIRAIQTVNIDDEEDKDMLLKLKDEAHEKIINLITNDIIET